MRYSESRICLSVTSLGGEDEGFRLVYITEKTAHQHGQNVTFRLLAAAWSFR